VPHCRHIRYLVNGPLRGLSVEDLALEMLQYADITAGSNYQLTHCITYT